MDKLNRPSTVSTAVQLLYITLIIAFVCGIINIIHVHSHPESSTMGIGPMTAVLVVSLVVCWFFFYNIARGRNWARIIYLILFILGILSTGWHLKMYLDQGMLISLATLVNYVIGIIALVLLFTTESNKWFKQPNKSSVAPEDTDDPNAA